MSDMTYQIHWMAFTVHAETETAFELYDAIFKEHIGSLEDKGHGGRGFKELYQGLLAFKLYTTPVALKGQYYHFEIPGQACEVIPWITIQKLFEYLEAHHSEQYHFRRIDLAFDNPGFSPYQFRDAIIEDRIRSMAKRESLVIHGSPFKPRDNGELGTYTAEFGSPSSERMVTVYNRRGPTRLELKAKGLRAELISAHLFNCPDVNDWYKIMIAHLLDFIDIDAEWWRAFINGIPRAGMTVTTAREITAEKLIRWLDKQVSPALSAVNDAYSEDIIEMLIRRGRKRRGARYNLLLDEVDDIEEPDEDEEE